MSAERLYTPQLLSAAVELANWPALVNAPFHADARAPTCGSTIAVDLILDDVGRIEQVGLRTRACAVGQAAAAVFARHATGRSLADVQAAHDQIALWLDDQEPAPDWPDLDLIAPARSFPARHGAMMLPWKAALSALSSIAAAG